GVDHRLAPPNVGRIEPRGGEPAPPVRHPDVHVPAGPAERHRVDVFLAVVFSHDPGDDRHRQIKPVLGLAGGTVRPNWRSNTPVN
ncbi:MAG TPA: hypothetical protein VIQ02_10675, partial [Jiangellaceae bacterium]